MGRQVKVTYKDIMCARGEHYEAHFQKHKFCMVHPARTYVLNVLPNLPDPKIDLFGDLNTMYLTADTYELFLANRVYSVEIQYMVSWYWSDQGWKDYQTQFQRLPEPLPEYVFHWGGGRMPELVPTKYPVDLRYDESTTSLQSVYNKSTTSVQSVYKKRVVHIDKKT